MAPFYDSIEIPLYDIPVYNSRVSSTLCDLLSHNINAIQGTTVTSQNGQPVIKNTLIARTGYRVTTVCKIFIFIKQINLQIEFPLQLVQKIICQQTLKGFQHNPCSTLGLVTPKQQLVSALVKG